MEQIARFLSALIWHPQAHASSDESPSKFFCWLKDVPKVAEVARVARVEAEVPEFAE